MGGGEEKSVFGKMGKLRVGESEKLDFPTSAQIPV